MLGVRLTFIYIIGKLAEQNLSVNMSMNICEVEISKCNQNILHFTSILDSCRSSPNSNCHILNLYKIHPHKNVDQLIQMHKNRKNDYMQLCQAAMIYITDTILECG